MIKDYLLTLHTRPEHHKKRFALLVSGTTTLIIFAGWCVVKTANLTPSNSDSTVTVASADPSLNAEGPLESLKASVSDAWRALAGQVNVAKQGLESVNVPTQSSLTTYGQ
jgi:hypothetical protein